MTLTSRRVRLESTRTILSGLLFQTTGVSCGQTSKWPDSQGIRESGVAFLLLMSSLMTLDLFTDGTTVIGAGILLGFVFVLSFTINLVVRSAGRPAPAVTQSVGLHPMDGRGGHDANTPPLGCRALRFRRLAVAVKTGVRTGRAPVLFETSVASTLRAIAGSSEGSASALRSARKLETTPLASEPARVCS